MIILENVSKIFNSGSDLEVRAVDALSLTISEGEWCNVIGPNGSGKSTLLRILAGEITPTSGKMLFDGKDITDLEQQKRAHFFQFVEQDTKANLVPSMTIEENLLLTLNGSSKVSLRPLRRKEANEKAIKCLKRFQMGLEKKLNVQTRLLSGGERQAIVLAKTILSNTKVLLLDEFLGAIDPRTAPILLDIVKELASEQGLNVIMVSHDLDQVIQANGRVIVLSKGHISTDIPNSADLTKEQLVMYYKQAVEASGHL